jgi:hypothetical protein
MNCEHHPPTDDLKSMEPRCNDTDRLKPMVKLCKTIIPPSLFVCIIG